MSTKELRVRIPLDLYKDLLHTCVDLNLTLPKQVTNMIRHFVETANQNKMYIKSGK